MNPENWVDRFEREDALGKVALVGETVVRTATGAIEWTLRTAAATIADAEKAFRREMDPTIRDAKILEEGKREIRGEKQEVGSAKPS